MAGALVSLILEQLASVTSKQMNAEVKLVAGVDDEVQQLTRNFRSIQAVLDDAESKQFKYLAVRAWLDELKETSYDINDVLDEWITRVGIKRLENASKPKRKVSRFMHFYFGNVSLHHDFTVKIKELNEKLKDIAMEKNMFNFSSTSETIELKRPETTSMIDDVSNIHGRDHDKDTLLKMLLSENSQGSLSEDESWSLFSKIVSFERISEEHKKFEDIGRRIIGKCKGLPLAIKTLGSLLRLKSSIREWQSILDSEIWELEEVEKWIFQPLLLSYYDLPSTLRKCFSYCAIFPKDYVFKKDKLIKLWMAQSYVRDKRIKDMEIIGEECFEELALRSFFQDFERDEFDGSIISCKMHDIVHDFAQFLTKNEHFYIEIDDAEESRVQFSFEKGRHLMVGLKSGDTFPMYINNAKKLHSLVVKCENVSNILNLFENFVCLRTLKLSSFNENVWDKVHIKEVPREIKNLIHLRYLDLSYNTELEELPETLCELYNLQTLNVNYCSGLKKLPQEMGKLINLRHLMNIWTCLGSLSEMPKGIEGLTGLRTLSEFAVCRNREGGGLEYLKNLDNLRGSLNIVGLGDVGDVGEVNKANLMNKTNLSRLGLYFSEVGENGDNGNIDEAIFEALQPPPNLETLVICDYKGKTLSLNWMVLLTKLKFLALQNCMNLEEWDISKEEGEDVTIIMPSLNSLFIEVCDKLKSLPDHILKTPTLKKLEITGCPILKERYNKETGVDIPNIIFD